MAMPFRVLGTLHLLSATGAKHVHGHRKIRMTNPARTLGGPRTLAVIGPFAEDEFAEAEFVGDEFQEADEGTASTATTSAFAV